MHAKQKPKVSRAIQAKARAVLAFAQERAASVADWLELHNALFSVDGKATQLFPTEAERRAFARTKEHQRVLALFDGLPSPPPRGVVEMTAPTNGTISVQVPRSVYEALLAEARAEGVSLNQLCLSKLVAQLRAVV